MYQSVSGRIPVNSYSIAGPYDTIVLPRKSCPPTLVPIVRGMTPDLADKTVHLSISAIAVSVAFVKRETNDDGRRWF